MLKKAMAALLAMSLMTALAAGCSGADTSTNASTGTNTSTSTSTGGETQGETIMLSYGSVLPADHQFSTSAARIQEKLMERTEGALGIEYFAGGQLGSEKDNVDSVVNGSLDLALASPGELGKRYAPLLMFDAPYVFENAEQCIEVLNGEPGQKLYEEFTAQTGLIALGNLLLGTRQLATAKIPVTVPADLEGQKIRVPDTPTAVGYMEAMGGKPTPMAITEVYLALQQGVVDGCENPISQILSNKFNEVTKYMSLTRHVVQTDQIIMNQERYESLSDDLQQVLADTIKEECDICVQEVLDYEEEIEAKLPEYGYEVIEADLDAFRTKVVEEFKSNEVWDQEVYDLFNS
ncbi:MAG: DctP family TRAP transporter solute-binding subunit [Eubacteriales bacterium]|jgi:tripartite ATP-independent transporter DctP family solute receptor